MLDVFHPSVKYDFATLVYELDKRVANGYLKKVIGPSGLVLYNYTNSCTYDCAWDEFTLMARGLILDTINHRVAAMPFPKFFNFGENDNSSSSSSSNSTKTVPDLPFQAYEKLDGSLILVFHHDGRWHTATRGSFNSDQAVWALAKTDRFACHLDKGSTYLFEAIYDKNRIVVRYDYEDLVLLGAYDKNGLEASEADLLALQKILDCKKARTYHFDNFSAIISQASILARNEEGFVVRFSNGRRLKMKGEEYRRIHRMISNLSPLSVWESMLNHDDLDNMRKELPEEFWTDFDEIRLILTNEKNSISEKIISMELATRELSDKDLGLTDMVSPEIKACIFNMRKNRVEKNHKIIMNNIRPTSNVLEGYSASSGLLEVQSEN